MVGDMPQQLIRRYSAELAIASAVYKGSGKRFFVRLAEQLDIPTEETKYDKNGEPCGEPW